jgi:hypothetical protein
MTSVSSQAAIGQGGHLGHCLIPSPHPNLNLDHKNKPTRTNTINMSETLLSILTGEPWLWDPTEANQITFNADGTGKV